MKITSELLRRYSIGLCSQEEKEAVEKWLNDPDSTKPGILSDDEFKIEEEKVRAKLSQAIPQLNQPNILETDNTVKASFSWIRYAAAIVILTVGISSYYYWYSPKFGANDNIVALEEYRTFETQRGQKRTINLPDGSTVHLNYESQLKIPEKFADSARTVFLSGHAHFDVARDPDRPFIIYTDNTKTQVLGTSFDIKTNERSLETEVIVTSGKVEFSEKTEARNKVILTVNNRAVLRPDQKINISEVNAQNLTAWKDNRLLFDNESLGEIIRVLELWYDVEITVKNPTLLSGIYKFSYDNPSLETLMERMSFMAKFEYTIKGKQVTIY